MRFPQLLGALAISAGCNQAPSPSRPAPIPSVAEEARTPSARAAEKFQGCAYDPDPLLTITSEQVLLDGAGIDEAQLERTLNDRQALYAQLGAPPKNTIVVRIAKGVPDSRVSLYLGTASRAGFFNVARLADFESAEMRPRRKLNAASE